MLLILSCNSNNGHGIDAGNRSHVIVMNHYKDGFWCQVLNITTVV